MTSTRYSVEALTDLWTGNWEGKPERLVTTGLLGSIRWWCEVVVRGLGGTACDPSKRGVRCPDQKGRRCVTCELFGCTGWARKFRFDVFDASGSVQREQLKEGSRFQLWFTPLRPVQVEEWALLDVTIRLIAGYGAIGGKTVYKPSDELGRENADHHRDYGLIHIVASPELKDFQADELRRFAADRREDIGRDEFAWASLENLWCVNGRYLARQNTRQSTFNRVVGRKEDKSIKEQKGRRVVRYSDIPSQRNDEVSEWLAGDRGKSKKILSFKDPPRTFGFVNPNKVNLNEIKRRLEAAWGSGSVDGGQLITGDQILQSLLHPEALA